MKIEGQDEHQKLLDYIRALKWWSHNLAVPLENGEAILFDKILDDMRKILETDKEK